MVVIEDTIGYVAGITMVLCRLGIGSFDILEEWAHQKDREAKRKKAYREMLEIRIKVAKKREQWNSGIKASKKAKAADYGSGIAMKLPPLPLAPKQVTSKKSMKTRACRCGSTKHQQTTAKDCPLNPKNNKDCAAALSAVTIADTDNLGVPSATCYACAQYCMWVSRAANFASYQPHHCFNCKHKKHTICSFDSGNNDDERLCNSCYDQWQQAKKNLL
jgi:hypothetical protein